MLKDKTLIIILLVAAGLSLRLVYLWQYSASPLFSTPLGPDVAEYDQWARAILTGQFFWQTVPIHGPLYPALLAGLYFISGYDFIMVRFAQLLIGVCGFSLLYIVLRALPGIRQSKIAVVVFAIAMLYVPLVYYQGELICESLLVPLLCGTIYALYRGERHSNNDGFLLVAGLLTGASVITHPMALLFAMAESLFLMWRSWRKETWRKSVIFIMAWLAILAPVSIYNSRLAGKPVLLQENSGLNFYIGNNRDATGSCYVRPGPAWNALINKGNTESYFSKTLTDIYESPLQWIGLLAKKTILVWNHNELISGADPKPLREYTTLGRVTPWMPGVILTLGLTGLILIFAKWRTIWLYRHFIILLLSFWLAQILTVTSARYRLAMLPAIFLGTAFFLVQFKYHWQVRRHLLVITIFFALLVVWLPNTPYDQWQDEAESNSLLGEAWFRKGEFTNAQTHLLAALPNLQDRVRCLNLLGIIAEKQGKPNVAVNFYQQAVIADPLSPEGYMNLAVIASGQKRENEAEQLFQAALAHAGENPDVIYNYAYHLERKGLVDVAESNYLSVLTKHPEHAKALNALGNLAMRQKKFSTAAWRFRQAVAVEPDNPNLMVNLAAATAAMGDTDKATIIVNQVLQKYPEHPGANRIKQMLTPR